MALVGPGGEVVTAKTDRHGTARLPVEAGSGPFDIYAAKPEISKAQIDEDRALLKQGKLARFLDAFAEGVKPAEKIELRRLHRSRIERALFPRVKPIVPLVSGADSSGTVGSIDHATCNFCAGITYAILDGLGYEDIRWNDTGIHITVRVATPDGEELAIDPSMPQFMTNGTKIDEELKERGGWMGTQAELEEFCRKHIHENNCHQAPDTPWAMDKAAVLLRIEQAALAYLERAKTAKPPEAEVFEVKTLLEDARTQLKEALFFERLLDDPSNDVFGYFAKKKLWEVRKKEALEPLEAQFVEAAVRDYRRQSITQVIADARKLWEEKGVKSMLGLFSRGNRAGGNFAAAERLLNGYKAWAKGGGSAAGDVAAGYRKIREAIESES